MAAKMASMNLVVAVKRCEEKMRESEGCFLHERLISDSITNHRNITTLI
jgi:hypothetical protein